MKSDAARNGGASNTGTGYLPFTDSPPDCRALSGSHPFWRTKTKQTLTRLFVLVHHQGFEPWTP